MSYLFLDIETIPDIQRIQGTKWHDGDQVTVPLNQLMPAGVLVDKTVEEIRGYLKSNAVPTEYLDAFEAAERASKGRESVFKAITAARPNPSAWVKTASLCPELCKIVCFGLGFEQNDQDRNEILCSDVLSDMEVEGLKMFWDLARSRQIVGYNCLAFDLPVIFARSAILGVTPSRTIDIGRYSKQVIDLYIRRFGGYPPSGHPADQKSMCRLYGMDVPEVDGSQVYGMWQSGDTAGLSKYQLDDLMGLRFLLQCWMGLFVF